ncbi:MAG: glycoside hydrolase family 99-like domain-containing protein [Acidimicrobiia bacterium]
MNAAPRARALALHLPQFHPIPENDEWWEPGFTEWTNVVKAPRRFPGHYQPHLPADLGFYDLRLVESLHAQADLAGRYGVEGFVFWHYWFAGRRILERPLELWRGAEGPQFGFALAWANQTWRGHWHGTATRILIEQTYPEDDDEAHFATLLPAFTDPRYLTVDDKPLFYVFRGEDLPEPKRFVDRWQLMAQRAGLPGLFLVAETNDPLGRGTYADPVADGFDAGVDLQLPATRTTATNMMMRALRRLGRPEIYPYARHPIERPPVDPERPIYPAIVPCWDNSPRSGANGLVLHRSTPEKFGVHARDAIERLSALRRGRRLLFVKSWNEWAEGNHLEPDQRFGRRYLEVLAEALGVTP